MFTESKIRIKIEKVKNEIKTRHVGSRNIGMLCKSDAKAIVIDKCDPLIVYYVRSTIHAIMRDVQTTEWITIYNLNEWRDLPSIIWITHSQAN